VKAIRIGADRDGSKTGVVLYAQEHAREWVTSLVALETAQRLLHNYGSDPTSTALVDDLDIFIIPMVNPDGAAYSLYDNLVQRTNMNVDGCAYLNPTNAGTDLNRNFTVGSLFDGFVGASDDCRHQTYAGSSELSEAESSNEVWLTEAYPNIKFAMNTHSFGGYFMWSPGAYTPDRETLPRPDLATEDYFFKASETILSRIKEYRGTVVWPGRTGPVVDVLYSAAGNSGDEFFYDDEVSNDPDIYAWDFEVGVPLWDETAQGWNEAATGFFWPDFETEGFQQAMEFANGWYGILEVARAYAADDEAPTSTSNVDGKGTYDGQVDVLFETSEPATVYYTTDGSRPTWDSPTVEQDGVRGERPRSSCRPAVPSCSGSPSTRQAMSRVATTPTGRGAAGSTGWWSRPAEHRRTPCVARDPVLPGSRAVLRPKRCSHVRRRARPLVAWDCAGPQRA